MNYSNGLITSCIKGVSITFSTVELGFFLNIPSEGLEIMMNKPVALQGYVKKDFYYRIARLIEHAFFQKWKKMVGGKLPDINSWSAGIFYIDDRLLQYILGYVILQKFSNHSSVTDIEMHIFML